MSIAANSMSRFTTQQTAVVWPSAQLVNGYDGNWTV